MGMLTLFALLILIMFLGVFLLVYGIILLNKRKRNIGLYNKKSYALPIVLISIGVIFVLIIAIIIFISIFNLWGYVLYGF